MGCLAVILLPIVEAVLLWKLGQRFGFLPTLTEVAVTALIGSWVARREGMRALNEVQRLLQAKQSPDVAVISGLLVFVGAALLAFPGPLSDVLGIVLLIPPSRALVATYLRRRWDASIRRGAPARRDVIDIPEHDIVERPKGD